MIIREAKVTDLEAWMKLLDSVKAYFPGLDMQEYRRQLKASMSRSEALAAIELDNLIGAVVFSKEAKEILFLAVHPAHRRAGAANQLLHAVMNSFQTGDVVRVTTYREHDNMGVGARSLYRRFGFIPESLITVFDYPCEVLKYQIPNKQ